MSTVDPSAPAPLRLPAILQNPTNNAQRQVEAHNAQQREKIAARREATRGSAKVVDRSGKGKRVIRRLDNATFASNPHIVAPQRSDFTPPIPLQPRPTRAAFPPGALPRSAHIPSVVPPTKDPRSSDSLNGAFSMTLRGTRALLRRRGGGGGRRVEQLVGRVESEIRTWLDGDFALAAGEGSNWRVVDDTPSPHVPFPVPRSGPQGFGPATQAGSTAVPGPNRHMPIQHRITGLLPALPPVSEGTLPAILEHSRSPAHLTWYINDGFERMVVHMICRYYELYSWSEQHATFDNELLRMTHIVLPSVARPPVQPDAYHLLTPETSELSSQSGPESAGTLTSDSEVDPDTESDTATERGDDDHDDVSVIGYELADTTITSLGPNEAEASDVSGSELKRVMSNTSSAYASSEGGGDQSDYEALGDSYVLPARPGGQLQAASSSCSDFGSESDIGELGGGVPPPPAYRTGGVSALGAFGRRGWEAKPTFFEYLYGA
ncbi:hypothetical protein IAU60_006650 [Kwoniella sp. DSM 27419]